jgi:hypothetical protein
LLGRMVKWLSLGASNRVEFNFYAFVAVILLRANNNKINKLGIHNATT